MSDEQGTVFVDGLRVTSQHLNHLEESAQQAVGDLRRVLGAGAHRLRLPDPDR